MLRQPDEGGPPVTGIGPPVDQAPGFEGVDHLGGRAGRDMQALREIGQAHIAVAVQHAQGAELGRGDVPGGQGFLGGLAQSAGDGPEGVRQRLVAAGPGIAGPGIAGPGNGGPGNGGPGNAGPGIAGPGNGGPGNGGPGNGGPGNGGPGIAGPGTAGPGIAGRGTAGRLVALDHGNSVPAVAVVASH